MPSLRDVRLATLLVHSLPDRVVAIDDDRGDRVLVSFRRAGGVALTPCALRQTVTSVLEDGDPAALGPALGLGPGPVRARILEEEIDDPHVGLGVYRYERRAEWGFVFATTLPVDCVERRVREVVSEIRLDDDREVIAALELGCLKVLYDPHLDVTAAFTEYAEHDMTVLHEPVRQITLRFATACLAEELVWDAC